MTSANYVRLRERGLDGGVRGRPLRGLFLVACAAAALAIGCGSTSDSGGLGGTHASGGVAGIGGSGVSAGGTLGTAGVFASGGVSGGTAGAGGLVATGGGNGSGGSLGAGGTTMPGDPSKDAAPDDARADLGIVDTAKPTDATDTAATQPGDGAAPAGPATTAAAKAMCTTDPATKAIACHFGGSPGNYDVTFVLGGAAAGRTEVQTETQREVLDEVDTSPGQTARYAFTLNVREPEGQPIQAVSAGTPGFDMYFVGAAPLLDAIGFASASKATVLYIAGDSTVCDQTDPEYAGWGQLLPPYFNLGLSVANYADSGESSASFLASGKLWGAIKSAMKAGDAVLIQFGHNDKTISAADFKTNLTAYVTQTKAKNAFPILVTPIARATFSGNTVTAQHQHDDASGNLVDLPAIIRQVGKEQNVPVIDLTATTTDWLTQVGPKGWQAYHALGTDATHTNRAGAAVNAAFVRDAIVSQDIAPLKDFLR